MTIIVRNKKANNEKEIPLQAFLKRNNGYAGIFSGNDQFVQSGQTAHPTSIIPSIG